MSEENTFDRITRILATPMPRRQAIKLAASIVATSTLELLGHQAQAEANVKQTKQLLPGDVPVHQFTASNESVLQIVRRLRREFQIPISLVETPKNYTLSFSVTNGTIKDVFKQLTKQCPQYAWEEYEGRLVIYSREAKYQAILSAHFDKGSRPEVTTKFITYLKTQVAGFDNFAGLTLIGNALSPVFTDLVSLSAKDTILHLFLDLLGSNQSAMFSILDDGDGIFTMGFNRVADFPAESPSVKIDTPAAHSVGSGAVAAASASQICRPLSVNTGAYVPDPTCVSPTTGQPDQPCPTRPAGQCGASKCVRYNGITTCPGDSCTGLTLSETITPDYGCSNQSPGIGIGCVVNGTTLTCCSDVYQIFIPVGAKPNGCTEIITQKSQLNGYLVQKNTLTFSIPVANGTCGTATVSESSVYSYQASQCCGTNPSSSGPDPMNFCDPSQTCVSDNGTANAICCPSGDPVACNHVCCSPGQGCFTDKVTGNQICCPTSTTSMACNGACCPGLDLCINGSCCPGGQITSDSKTCCPSGQTPYGIICCTTGQNNCNGTCCANTCCGTVCCAAGQTCAGGVCCGQPTPQARMSAEVVARGSYATDDLSLCCAPGHPPCGNLCCASGSTCCNGTCCAGTCCGTVCCASGSVCCNGSCCAGTCDSTGVCIPPPGENK